MANLQRAVSHYEAALRIYTEGDFPVEWAKVMDHLGKTFLARSQFEHNPLEARRALSCFESAARGFSNAGMVVEAGNCKRQADDARAGCDKSIEEASKRD